VGQGLVTWPSVLEADELLDGTRFEAATRMGTDADVNLSLAPTSSVLPELRRRAARTLRGINEEVAAEVLLALDEAVSNAIRHGSAGGEPVLVSLEVDDGWIEMTVRDHGPTPRLPRLPGAPPPTLATGGRGLWLILQLVDEVRLARAGTGTLLALRRRAESRVGNGV
jgi:serine/threonine-protein kinase RsbW